MIERIAMAIAVAFVVAILMLMAAIALVGRDTRGGDMYLPGLSRQSSSSW